jgi:AraC-like DNA-binding protein
MSEMVSRHTRLLTGTIETSLGRVMLAGEHVGGPGSASRRRWRVYGSYAVVFVTGGSGGYRDTGGLREELIPGDVIFVFPELAHWYGPRRKSERWDELYLTFDGPVFSLWRQVGLLDPATPIQRLGRDGLALAESLRAWVLHAALPASEPERLRQLTRLLGLLTEALTLDKKPAPHATSWLADACGLLESELSESAPMTEIARRVGLPYETFRKRFTEALGLSPARYRTARRIDAACQLLRFTPQLTNREAAEALGFADEFHFSRRFKELVGVGPREFRQRGDSHAALATVLNRRDAHLSGEDAAQVEPVAQPATQRDGIEGVVGGE